MAPEPRLVCASVNTEVCLPLPVTACSEAVIPVRIIFLIIFPLIIFLRQVCVAVTRTACAPVPRQACAGIEVEVCTEEPEVRHEASVRVN